MPPAGKLPSRRGLIYCPPMAASKPRNFSAGPAILPASVCERAAAAVDELQRDGHLVGAPGIGLSLLEISHRSPEFTYISDAAEELCHEVIGLPRTPQVSVSEEAVALRRSLQISAPELS